MLIAVKIKDIKLFKTNKIIVNYSTNSKIEDKLNLDY